MGNLARRHRESRMHAKCATWFTALVSATVLAGPAGAAPQSSQPPAGSDAGFQRQVAPILKNVCSNCHNDRLASGGLNVLGLTEPKSVKDLREIWETIVRQVRGGEMPPRGTP